MRLIPTLFTRRLRLALPALMALATLAGCTDFDIRWKVTDFRILAVAATDSSEEFVDGIPLIDPTLDPSELSLEDIPSVFRIVDRTIDFVIELLVVDPNHPKGPFRLRARACPYVETYSCDDANPDLVIEAVPPFEVNDTRDLKFVFRPDDDWLNEVLAEDLFKGFGGLYVMLDIDIEGPSGMLRATKTLSFNLAQLPLLLGLAAEEITPNRNPRLCGVRIVGLEPPRVVLRKKSNFSLCDDYNVVLNNYVDYDAPFTVPAGTELTVRPLPPLDRDGQLRAEEEAYYVLTFPTRAGELPGLRRLAERIEVDVYATGGKLEDDRAFTRSVFGAQVSPEFKWTVPDRPGPVTLWVVVRDNRGGVTWFDRTIMITEE